MTTCHCPAAISESDTDGAPGSLGAATALGALEPRAHAQPSIAMAAQQASPFVGELEGRITGDYRPRMAEQTTLLSLTHLSGVRHPRMALGMKHSNDDEGLGIHSKVDRMRKPADEGSAQATLAGFERDGIPKDPNDGCVKGVSISRPQARTTLLVPLEGLEHVRPGLLS